MVGRIRIKKAPRRFLNFFEGGNKTFFGDDNKLFAKHVLYNSEEIEEWAM